MKYEVTIGIPTYKAVDYIEKTMESALNQTFGSIEYLIVDDCGNDGTIEVVEQFLLNHPRGKDIHIVYNKENIGVGRTRNIILEQAKGKYLYFLDSDDLIEPDTISLLVDMMHKNHCDVVYASYEKIDTLQGNEKEKYQYPYSFFDSDGIFAKYVFDQYGFFQVSVCNCLYDLSFLRRYNIRFLDACFWEDMAFTYDVVTNVKRACLLPNVTYHYICRPHSLSNYQKREILSREEIFNNFSIVDYLKTQCKRLRDKNFIPGFCYVAQMNSFYMICYILKYREKISPGISVLELYQKMQHPLNLRSIITFRYKRNSNVLLWLIARLPVSLFIVVVYLLGKIKRIL
jgi:glycosyltransferase involved in cell wall biosynthesis